MLLVKVHSLCFLKQLSGKIEITLEKHVRCIKSIIQSEDPALAMFEKMFITNVKIIKNYSEIHVYEN